MKEVTAAATIAIQRTVFFFINFNKAAKTFGKRPCVGFFRVVEFIFLSMPPGIRNKKQQALL